MGAFLLNLIYNKLKVISYNIDYEVRCYIPGKKSND